MQRQIQSLQGSAQIPTQRNLERRGRRSSSLSSLSSLSQHNTADSRIAELLASIRGNRHDLTRRSNEIIESQNNNMTSDNIFTEHNQLDMSFRAIAHLSNESDYESDDDSDSESGTEFVHSEDLLNNNLDDANNPLPSDDRQSNDSDPNPTSTEHIKFLHTVRQSMKYTLRWERLLAFTAVTGSDHFTEKNLTFLAKAVATSSKGSTSLPTYKTLKANQWRFMRDNLYVRSTLLYIAGNHTQRQRAPRGKTVDTANMGSQDIRDCVRMILPSDWACLDIQTLPMYNELFIDKNPSERHGVCIEDSPLLNNCDRREFLSGTKSIWARYRNTVVPSRSSEILIFPIGEFIVSDNSTSENDLWFTIVEGENCFKGRVGPTWCVRSGESENPQLAASKLSESFHTDELLVHFYLSIATHKPTDFNIDLSNSTRKQNPDDSDKDQPDQDNGDGTNGDRHNCPSDYNTLFSFPGDFCTLIRPVDGEKSRYVVLFLASHIWREDGRVGERILFFNREYLHRRVQYELSYHNILTSKTGDRLIEEFIYNMANLDTIYQIFPMNATSLELSKVIPVTGLPSFPETSKPSYLSDSNRSVKNRGILKDGTPYLIYRFFLYLDGFKEKKSLSDQRSVTGCYLLPAGLRHQSRTTCTCVRTLTIAPHRMDPNIVLSHIVDDVVNGAVHGINTVDAYGNIVKLFLDIPGTLADTLAQTAGADLKGHTADAYCAYCSSRKRKGLPTPPITYTTTLHSRRQSLVRSDERMREIRACTVHEDVQKHIGTSCTTEEDSLERLSVKLASAFQSSNETEQVILDQHNQPVLDSFFDSYQSAAVVPDHLFKGLITNVLTVCFNAIPDDSMRSHLDNLICHSIRENNLHSIDTILNWDKHGEYKGINNLKTSSLLCVNVFAAPILKQYGENITKTLSSIDSELLSTSAIVDSLPKNPLPFHLPTELQKIISLSYWCPQETQNTKSDIEYVFGKDNMHQTTYFGDLQRLATLYISSIQKYYTSSGVHAKHLDKPNAHRLIEFVYHTVPTFGHALNVSEMVLEQAHRHFKGWLEKNTQRGAHITAVELDLARDWMNRVYALFTLQQKGTDEEKTAALFGLSRLMFGAIDPNRSKETYNEATEHLIDKLPEALESPVLEAMRGHSQTTMLQSAGTHWKLKGKSKMDKEKYFRNGVKVLDRVHYASAQFKLSDYKQFAIASLQRANQCGDISRTSTFNNIKEGSFVSAKINNPRGVVLIPKKDSSSIKFYVVFSLAKSPDKKNWIFVKALKKDKKSNGYYIEKDSVIQCIRLNQSVTVVGKVFSTYDFSTESHNPDYGIGDSNSQWIILSNREGFPPRMS